MTAKGKFTVLAVLAAVALALALAMPCLAFMDVRMAVHRRHPGAAIRLQSCSLSGSHALIFTFAVDGDPATSQAQWRLLPFRSVQFEGKGPRKTN